MKLFFILHGFHPNWLYSYDAKYAACWRAERLDVPSKAYAYEKCLLAFIDLPYTKRDNTLPWLNYKLKKLL